MRGCVAAALFVAALSAVLLGGAGIPGGWEQTAAAQSSIRWGGRWQVRGDTALDDDGRMSLDTALSLRVQARTATYPWRVFFDGQAGVKGPLAGPEERRGPWKGEGELHRLYARYDWPQGHLSFGKQFVNWGVGYAFSPTDVFNPPDPTDPDGVRPGIVAAVGQWAVGPLDYWTVAVADRKYGVRRRGNAAGTDWSVLAVYDRGDTIFGADFKGDWGLGWHGAAVYRKPEHSGPARLEGLLGADYSWLGGRLLWIGEVPFAVSLEGDGRPRYQMYQRLTYRIDEFTSVYGSLLWADLRAGPPLWGAGLITALTSESELRLLATLRAGSAASLPGIPPQPKAMLRAEYSHAF